ncbi:hypothetical protein Syun_001742 [Stephania yunnanensis]|uniref:Uncharacterized protein n=1 Tax=Stephania yunnanensis TaxID=152371 RepID=A0AAP0LE90_9MAGN
MLLEFEINSAKLRNVIPLYISFPMPLVWINSDLKWADYDQITQRFSEAIEKLRKRRKGYFTMYAREGKRFVVPLYYLNHPIFKVLLEMTEEEFGLAAQGPLQVPYEEELMDHIVSFIRNKKP